MADQNQSEPLNIPVLHHNKQIHVLLFILICVLIAGFSVYFTIILPSQTDNTSLADQNAEILNAQKQQAFEEIKDQISTAPPISQQQKERAFNDIKRIRGQQEI